jgi:hypothetical protein
MDGCVACQSISQQCSRGIIVHSRSISSHHSGPTKQQQQDRIVKKNSSPHTARWRWGYLCPSTSHCISHPIQIKHSSVPQKQSNSCKSEPVSSSCVARARSLPVRAALLGCSSQSPESYWESGAGLWVGKTTDDSECGDEGVGPKRRRSGLLFLPPGAPSPLTATRARPPHSVLLR